MDAPNNWRVRPPASAAHEIRQLALNEGRSLSNMVTRLVVEALEARRRRADHRMLENDHRISA